MVLKGDAATKTFSNYISLEDIEAQECFSSSSCSTVSPRHCQTGGGEDAFFGP